MEYTGINQMKNIQEDKAEEIKEKVESRVFVILASENLDLIILEEADRSTSIEDRSLLYRLAKFLKAFK